MKFIVLEKIVKDRANALKEGASYSGAWNDGGCDSLLRELAEYKNTLVVKEDLRPSDFYKLNHMEIGEPICFSSVIDDYKIKLARNIKL